MVTGSPAIGGASIRVRVRECWLQEVGHVRARGGAGGGGRPADRRAGAAVPLRARRAAAQPDRRPGSPQPTSTPIRAHPDTAGAQRRSRQ